jgi:hypothetical protein
MLGKYVFAFILLQVMGFAIVHPGKCIPLDEGEKLICAPHKQSNAIPGLVNGEEGHHAPCCTPLSNDYVKIYSKTSNYDKDKIFTVLANDKHDLTVEIRANSYQETEGQNMGIPGIKINSLSLVDHNGSKYTMTLDKPTNDSGQILTAFDLSKYYSSKVSKNSKYEIKLTYGDGKFTIASNDNFAIRPEKFVVTNASDMNATSNRFYSSVETSPGLIQVEAVGKNGSNITNFDGKAKIKFIESQGRSIGSFDSDDKNLSFGNSVASSNRITYGEVGILNVTIEDINGAEQWAKVDENDNGSNYTISSSQIRQLGKFYPYKIVLNDESSSSDYMYMGSDINTTYSISAKAYRDNTNVSDNYGAYVEDVIATLSLNVTSDGNTTYRTNNFLVGDVGGSKNIDVVVPASSFDGTSQKTALEIPYNIERNKDVPVNPIEISLGNIVIDKSKNSNKLYLEESKIANSDTSTTFYYGRVDSKDLSTPSEDGETTVFVEVYHNGNTSAALAPSSKSINNNWYVNENDNTTQLVIGSPEQTSSYKKTSTNTLSSLGLSVDNSGVALQGSTSIKVTNSDNVANAYIHFKTPEYLWYSKTNKSYNYDGASTTCLEHSCFEYYYVSNLRKSIKTGNFSGASINLDDTADDSKKKSGSKLFR